MQIEIGAILEGHITVITKFGAFMALPEGKSGLIHISEVADAYVKDVHDFLTEGQMVKAKVISISPEGKIGLSIKKAAEHLTPRVPEHRIPAQPQPMRAQAAEQYVPVRSDDQVFEDKLRAFMQDADRKISGNKLFEQQKRTRGRKK